MAEEKGFRLLSLYDQLVNRGSIQKKEAAQVFGVSERSIQRDIEQLRNFFAEQTPPLEIHYDLGQNCYRLSEGEGAFLSCGEMLAVCKILLESRSLSKREMDQILDKLLVHGMRPPEREKLQEIISNERHFYVEPRHGKSLVDILWTLGQAIQSRSEIQADYRTQTGEKKHRRLQPVGLMCSEFYFYLAAFLKNVDRNQEFEYPEDPIPLSIGWTVWNRSRYNRNTLPSHMVSAFQRGNSESGSNSCTEGGCRRSIFCIKGRRWRLSWTVCPQRRSSASGTGRMRFGQRYLERGSICG